MRGCAARTAVALAASLCSALAVGMSLHGPGVGLSGQPITRPAQVGTQGVRVSQTFQMPLPDWNPSALQRWWMGQASGTLTLSTPKISWRCPAGRGRSATRAPALTPRLIGASLRAGGVGVPAKATPLAWDKHVLIAPDLTFAVEGRAALALFDRARTITLRAELLLPGPATAWEGCVPKLHARTLLTPALP